MNVKKDKLIKLGVTDTELLNNITNMSDEEFENTLELKKKEWIAEQERLKKERQDKERLQKQLKEKEDRERADKQKAENEAHEKAEKERKKALAPDKEKLLELANTLETMEFPAVKDEKAMQILVGFRKNINDLNADLRERIKEL